VLWRHIPTVIKKGSVDHTCNFS